MTRWIALLLPVTVMVPGAFAQSNSQPKRIEKMRETKSNCDRRNHRFAPYRNRNDNKAFRSSRSRNTRSWNRYSFSRAQRFRQSRDYAPGAFYFGGGHGFGHCDSRRGALNRRGTQLQGYSYFDAADAGEIYFNQSYYDDGPYGPGFYDRNRWYSWYVASHRTGQLLDRNQEKVDEGMRLFRVGRYDRAAIAWLAASRADQGDAASRIHAGHALIAVGRYDDAFKLLARGFELAPQLATSSYDIRADYSNPLDFERHLTALKSHVVKHPNDAGALTLLGYAISYTDGPAAAYDVLKRAKRLDPRDTFIDKLWETARSVRPLTEVSDAQDREALKQPTESKRRYEKEATQIRSQRSKIKRVRWAENR